MAGYTRQSVADIINGLDITAPPLNAELNQLAAAFVGASGHSHDGTDGNAPKIDLTTSVDGYLPAVHGGVGGLNKTDATTNPTVTNDNTQGYAPGSLWLNNSTGRVFLCAGNNTGAAIWREVAQVTENDVFFPETSDTVDLGTTAQRFRNLFLSGGLTMAGNAAVGGTLSVTGQITASSGVAGNLTGDVTGDLTGNVTSSGVSTFASADINGGSVDGTPIGAANASTVRGTTITALTEFAGALTGDVTGNVTGDLTGNVTAPTGTSAFNNVTVNGQVDFTNTQLQNVSDPTLSSHAATKNYVDTQLNNLIGGAPSTLDTLNEIAEALNDDANAYATLDAKIDTKVDKAGDTLTGDLAMSGNIITGLKTPSVGSDAVNLTYITTLFGSTDDAATSADLANRYAEESEDIEVETGTFSAKHYSIKSEASANAAASSESNAASSENAAAASLDEFTDLYLGSKSSEPTLDNDGDALQDGALYKDTNTGQLRYYSISETAWKATTPGPTEQASIDTVVNNITDVNSVAANISDVGTVSTNIADVQNVSVNMTSVQDASGSLDNVHTAMLQMAAAFTNSQTRYVEQHAFV